MRAQHAKRMVYVEVYVAKRRVLSISIKRAFLSFHGGHSLRQLAEGRVLSRLSSGQLAP